MSISEYLSFVPLLLYGLALADLVSQWKRFLEPKSFYFPYLAATIALTEVGIHETYIYYFVLDELSITNYENYLINLASPFSFLLTVSIFTPESNDDTKTYFNSKLPLIVIFFILFLLSHFIRDHDFGRINNMIRLALIPIMLLYVKYRKLFVAVIIAVLWLVMFLNRLNEIQPFIEVLS